MRNFFERPVVIMHSCQNLSQQALTVHACTWVKMRNALACWSWKSKKEREKFQAAGRGAYKPIRELKNED